MPQDTENHSHLPMCPHCKTVSRNIGQQVCHMCGKPLFSGPEGSGKASPRRFEYQPQRFEYGAPPPPPPPSSSPPPASHRPESAARGSSRTARGGKTRTISTGLFGTILLCAFLPFLTVSCATQEYKVRGTDIIDLFGLSSQSYDYEAIPESVVVLSVLIVLAFLWGGVVSLFKSRLASLIAALAGGVGTVCMIALQFALDHELDKPADDIPDSGGIIPGDIIDTGRDLLSSSGLLKVNYQSGYWLILALFGVATLFNIWLTLRPPRQSHRR